MKDTDVIFYYKGKYYNSDKEFTEAIKNWPDEPFDIDWFRIVMDTIRKEAEFNHATNPNLSNLFMYNFLSRLFKIESKIEESEYTKYEYESIVLQKIDKLEKDVESIKNLMRIK